MVSHVWIPQKWIFKESTTMDSPLTPFSLSYLIEPPDLSILKLNAVATIRRPPSTRVTLETTINKGERASVLKSRIFNIFVTNNFQMLCNKNRLTYAVT